MPPTTFAGTGRLHQIAKYFLSRIRVQTWGSFWRRIILDLTFTQPAVARQLALFSTGDSSPSDPVFRRPTGLSPTPYDRQHTRTTKQHSARSRIPTSGVVMAEINSEDDQKHPAAADSVSKFRMPDRPQRKPSTGRPSL
jgi:hypothetical protein